MTTAINNTFEHYATYSPEDNKLRLYLAYRVPRDEYLSIREKGFINAPKQDCLVAPMWTPAREDFLLELCGQIDDEDTSLVERQEQRAERFDGYSDNRKRDADQAHEAVAAIADNIPLGQPILVGHHSERRARRDAERITNGMRKAIRLWETSEYWVRRAQGAIRHAKYKELPGVRARRIKGLEADKRKQEREIKECQTILKLWNSNLTPIQARLTAGRTNAGRLPCVENANQSYSWWSAYDVLQSDDERYSACPSWTVDQVVARANEHYPSRIAHAERWIAHLDNRLLYERTMLESQGASDLLKPKPKPTLLPLCNYRQPFIQVENRWHRGEMMSLPQVEMTSAEYKKIYVDYKGTYVAENSHRIRSAMIKHELVSVFLTDSKIHAKPDAGLPPEPKARQVREYTPPVEKPEAAPFEAMRESLKAGVQVVSAPQLFPTPRELAERMAELAGVSEGLDVLEPSAGTGMLIGAIGCRWYGTGGSLVAVEINNKLAERLQVEFPITDVRCADFLECNSDLGKFDRIIMNPPFENASDVKHITHARKFLKPGGRLVALCANGTRQRAALEPIADYWEELPPKTFSSQGTGVNVCLMIINAKSQMGV